MIHTQITNRKSATFKKYYGLLKLFGSKRVTKWFNLIKRVRTMFTIGNESKIQDMILNALRL